MKTIIALLVLVGFAQAISYADVLETEWRNYRLIYNKIYDASELQQRKEIFMDNMKMMDEHNARYEAGEESYEMGMNEFTDWTEEEFVSRRLSSLDLSSADAERTIDYEAPQVFDVPASIDWRTKGAVTAVKNQGSCGSCWSFSAAGTLEGRHFLKTGRLTALSEQNLVDCSSRAPYNNKGCNGGWPAKALKYVIDNGGINSASAYPYEAVQKKCRYDNKKIAAKAKTLTYVAANENALKEAVGNSGPISVAIDARQFKSYKGGVFNDKSCTHDVNHGVVVVGYGNDKKGGDFWLVKNSWGPGWGEEGYIRMARNRKNQCAIANHGVFPNV